MSNLFHDIVSALSILFAVVTIFTGVSAVANARKLNRQKHHEPQNGRSATAVH